MSEKNYHFETLQVRVGQEAADPVTDARAVPIYQTTSYVFHNAQHAADRFALKDPGYIYGRLMNPTQDVFEKRIAALEGGAAALAFASGAAAITATFQGLAHAGDHIVAQQTIYGGSYNLLAHTVKEWGIDVTFVDPKAGAQGFADAIRPNTKCVFIETVGNPNADLIDIEAVAAAAHAQGVPVVIDNTFATPVLQRPLELGADVVVHSATKYLDGQGRVLGGAVLGSQSYMKEKLEPVLRYTGPALSAFNAWILLGGLQTLPVRIRTQSDSALAVARWLEAHPAVARVYYPGLASHPQHELAKRQQSGFGPVLAFEVKGTSPEVTRQNAWQVVDSCQVVSVTANLGDVKTTITHPASTTHGKMSPEARAAAGIGEGQLRMAIGLESPEDICADLQHGLSKAVF